MPAAMMLAMMSEVVALPVQAMERAKAMASAEQCANAAG